MLVKSTLIIILMCFVANCDARFNNFRKSTEKFCNKEAYAITQNTYMYRCFKRAYSPYDCLTLSGFYEYNNIYIDCIHSRKSFTAINFMATSFTGLICEFVSLLFSAIILIIIMSFVKNCL